MLFSKCFWPGIEDGSITLAFRRWQRAAARPGALHRTPVGRIEILSVENVEPGEIREDEARRAGFDDRAELLAALARREGDTYRIEFRHAGADPRISLRERDELDDAELEAVLGRLRRFDQTSRSGPWTGTVLSLIERRPGVVAAELAAELGRERLPFKRDVRKLKELGLTESLRVGYRLSPRGIAVLRAK